MIHDLNEVENIGRYDLCIVGSGPSGMTVANELKESGLKICILESGGLKPTKHGDLLRNVKSEGIHIKEYSRERVLGGASTTWSGLSSPLDIIDMKTRSYLPHSGWPISRDELLPFYDNAARDYRFPPMDLFGESGLDHVRKKGDFELSWTNTEEKVFMAASEPQNFGKEFKYIFDTKGLDLYLNATLISLDGDGGSDSISVGNVRSGDNRAVKIEAKAFVLAAGGIENARILLNSKDNSAAGLGNDHDQVGRYLMNHPKNYYGVIHLRKSVKELPYYFGSLNKGYAGYAGLRLKESLQEEKKRLNCYVRFEPLFPWSDNQGVEGLVFLVKKCKVLLKSWMKMKEEDVVSLRDYSETGDDTDLMNERKTSIEWLVLFFIIILNLHRVIQYLYYRLAPFAVPKIKKVRLRNFMEMAPDPENRITLGKENDLFGQQVPVVIHQTSEIDRQSLIDLHKILKDELLTNGMGDLKTELDREEPWPITQDASHHLGSTRMGNDPGFSVVNPDCRLHGVTNVFLAGGSVFPTSGCANPTFTMVALSIRLAAFIKMNVFGLS